jgi:hypothetical protein
MAQMDDSACQPGSSKGALVLYLHEGWYLSVELLLRQHACHIQQMTWSGRGDAALDHFHLHTQLMEFVSAMSEPIFKGHHPQEHASTVHHTSVSYAAA